jgi:dolichyl-diphosphooligosaccharide--protein glycosyltransferase
MVEGDLILEERKRKVKEFLKNSSWIYIIILIAILILTFNVRTSNIPQLKDITTGNYTLGPDLDPFLALRWAQYIEANGSLMQNDAMRNVPLGYDTKGELLLWPYSIVWTHKALEFLGLSESIEYAAILHPVIFFIIASFFLFLFVRRVFKNEGITKSNIIALISTFLFTIIPSLLHRTVAGIPEKESPGIAFIMIALYFFVCMIQSKRIRKSLLYGGLSGIATGMAGLFWGGYIFLLLGIALTMLASFFLSKISRKEILGYATWTIAFTLILGVFTTHYGGIVNLLFSTTSGSCYFMLILLLFDQLIFKTKIKEKLTKFNLPRPLLSFILTIIILVIIILILSPAEIVHIVNDVYAQMFKSFADSRFTLTVAENSRPFFDSWIANFGLTFFWMFIVSSIILVYETVKHLKEKIYLMMAYIIFIFALIFSKYAQNSTFNGTNFISQATYGFGFLLLALTMLWASFNAHKKNEEINLDKGIILLLALFIFGLISARSAIRLFLLLAIPTPILIGYGTVKLTEYATKIKDETNKIISWVVVGVFIFLLIFSFQKTAPFIGAGVIPTLFERTSIEAKYTIPSAYTMQWQKAMAWVREETPKDSVFSHWWDYGYWVQSMGERATVLDGGNTIVYWNHLFGRHVLTGTNESEALEFLKTHKTNYLLIDPTDIGKYPAYSSIGSDENYDRYSWINNFNLDEKSSKETRNETLYFYKGGTLNDADIVWGNQIIPEQSAVVAGMILPIEKQTNTIKQPSIAIVYQQKQINIPIKCVYLAYSNKRYSFDTGLDSCMYVMPMINENSINNLGSAMYISEKGMNALWVKLYLFDETEAKANETKNFELVHSEQDLVVEQLRNNYNLTIPDFIVYGDLKGPIKIWKINYPDNIQENPEYMNITFPKKELYLPRGV